MRLVFLRIPVAEKRFRWIESIGGATCIVVVFLARDLVLHLTPLTHADGVGGGNTFHIYIDYHGREFPDE
jgi:hypothetical protein